MAKRTVGVQLIVFGKRTREDLAGVLDDVAEAGYQAVETGYLGEQVSGKEFKKMLEDRGLVHVGSHFGGPALDQIDKVIDWVAETGGTDIPLSDDRSRGQGLEAYKQLAEQYNAAGSKCAKAGLVLSYHNHTWELQEHRGVLPLEYLYEQTDPDLVKLCIDTYWIWDGGVDPAEFVGKYADRLRILHAKDSYLEETGQRSFGTVGEGVLDFPAIFKAIESSPAPWIVVEQDVPDHDRTPLDCSAASRKNISNILSS